MRLQRDEQEKTPTSSKFQSKKYDRKTIRRSQKKHKLYNAGREKKCTLRYIHGYKLSNSLDPRSQTLISNEPKATSRRLAEQGIMKPPVHKSKLVETSTRYKTIQNWNKIPSEIKHCKTADMFKMNFQSWKCKTK